MNLKKSVILNVAKRSEESHAEKNSMRSLTTFGMTLTVFVSFSIFYFLFSTSAALAQTTVTLDNPLGTTDFRIIVGNIVRTLTGGAGMLALLMFIYGGFTWLTAAGNSEKIQKGRDILVWSTAGMVVMFSSYFIVRFIILAITRGVVTP
ncbi:hypothetical protein HY477_04020 [Candidatus Uhrbacteria bacterium]|nr:hypothetical protein [Candidatus Uhrbacteria bacterium]